MSRIVVNQIQRNGGAVLNLPAADGAAGTVLTTNGAGNLSFNSVSFPYVVPLVAPESVGNFGSISTHSGRINIYSTGEWGSSGPWTTFVNNQCHTDNTAIQFMNMTLGDGFGADGTTQQQFIGDTEGDDARTLLFSSGNRLGYSRDQFMYDNTSGAHSSVGWRIMPIRNPTASPITVTLSGCTSDQWSSGQEGSQLFVFFTAANTPYSAVTAVQSVSLAATSNSVVINNLTGSFTFPANSTALVCLSNTDRYQTTYRFKDVNFFHGLNGLDAAGLICDMRMLSSLRTTRFGLPYTGSFTTGFTPLWTKTAAIYGDR